MQYFNELHFMLIENFRDLFLGRSLTRDRFIHYKQIHTQNLNTILRSGLFLISFLFVPPLLAQFSVSQPIVNTGNYTITDSVYMDPNGNDANPGTLALPVKTFTVAIQKLPYGVAGVKGGHAYGVIRLKPGYYATNGFQQSVSNWRNGNVFRDISIEGLGEVVIGGTSSTFATGHLLILSGDHIFIKNLKLKYSTGIGILLSRNDTSYPRQSNVLIDNVVVDSVGSFCMLLTRIDTVMVTRSAALYSSRPGNDNLTSPCQWPSGLKFLNSYDCTIHDCEVAYSRGEGLNFQNSLRCNAYRNRLHDNGLNFYNDNSAKLYVHQNHLFNTPGIGTRYWRNCPADTGKIWASGGMLIANEGSCVLGNLPGFSGCQTKCVLPNETFSNVDSMFVYNNIFQNIGEAIGFWEGANNITGVNCIRNVFIFNNTIIGVMGMPGAGYASLIKAYFPDYNLVLNSYYGYLQNVKITNNIFCYDTVAYPFMRPVNLVFHPQHPGPKDITFNNNLWVKGHAYLGTADVVRNYLPGSAYLLSDSLNAIQPCQQQPQWVYTGAAPFSWLNTDYLNRARNSIATNVGALEYSAVCKSTFNGIAPAESKQPSLAPNPCVHGEPLTLYNLPAQQLFKYKIISTSGKVASTGLLEGKSISTEGLTEGLYFLVLQGEQQSYILKLVIVP